jgi:hypothetical protein
MNASKKASRLTVLSLGVCANYGLAALIDIQLLLVFSAHALFLSGCVVQTRELAGPGK